MNEKRKLKLLHTTRDQEERVLTAQCNVEPWLGPENWRKELGSSLQNWEMSASYYDGVLVFIIVVRLYDILTLDETE